MARVLSIEPYGYFGGAGLTCPGLQRAICNEHHQRPWMALNHQGHDLPGLRLALHLQDVRTVFYKVELDISSCVFCG